LGGMGWGRGAVREGEGERVLGGRWVGECEGT